MSESRATRGQVAGEGGDERTQDRAGEPGRVRHLEAKTIGHAQDPLAHGGARKEVVHAEGGGIGHSAAETAGTKSAPFAREGDDAAMAALGATHAQKSVRQDAAAEVDREFVAYKGRKLAAAGLDLADKLQPVFLQRPVGSHHAWAPVGDS